jgi:hypothetical protein
MKKIWIIRFLFENRLHWQLEGEQISTNSCFRLTIYLETNETLIHYSLYVLDKGAKDLSLQMM